MKKKVSCTQYHLKQVIFLLDVNEIESLHIYFDESMGGYQIEYVREHPNSFEEVYDYNRLKAATLLRDFAKMMALQLVESFELTYSVNSEDLAYNYAYHLDPCQVSYDILMKELKQTLNQASELVMALELEDFQINRLFSKDGFNYKSAKMIDVIERLTKAIP